jgi:hypothetical protein
MVSHLGDTLTSDQVFRNGHPNIAAWKSRCSIHRYKTQFSAVLVK